MKKQNIILTIAAGTVLSFSIASAALAAAPAPEVRTEASASAASAVENSEEKKDSSLLFGRISKIEKDQLEIEVAEDKKPEADAEKDKAAAANEASEKQENMNLVLNGEKEKVKIEKTTVIQKGQIVKPDDKPDDKKDEKKDEKKDDKKDEKEKIETIKQDDLKVGDIVKITRDKDKKAAEITVLENAAVTEAKKK